MHQNNASKQIAIFGTSHIAKKGTLGSVLVRYYIFFMCYTTYYMYMY